MAVLMPSVGGTKEITDYFHLFDYDINLLVGLFQKVQIETRWIHFHFSWRRSWRA